jgi:hypothetical protein
LVTPLVLTAAQVKVDPTLTIEIESVSNTYCCTGLPSSVIKGVVSSVPQVGLAPILEKLIIKQE